MNNLIRTLVLSLFSVSAIANQPVDDFSHISNAYVHDTQNSQASKVAKTEVEWIITTFQSCRWQLYQPKLDLQRYVFSFFDTSDQLMMSGQLVDSSIYMSAGEGIFVCAVPVSAAERIRQIQ